MKKFLFSFVILSTLMYAKCDSHAQKLIRTYPQLKACQNNQIIWKDGTKMVYDDGKRESEEKILKHADIEDMFTHSYTAERYSRPRHDPGRYRNERFFRHMYGNSASAVRRHLTTINWFGRKVRVTTANNVHRHLKAVERDLKQLLKRHPEYRKYLVPIGGTFKWRKIAGTNRLSVHSFGAAIDINVKYSAYWRWSKGMKYQNQIPIPIVKIFEKHGFIWGGKWRHFDTMHFEYRPELLGSSVGRLPKQRTASSTTATHKKATKQNPGNTSGTYTVISGDTLYGIARKLHVTSQALQEANGITDPGKIRIGQILKVPH